jgi:hypothetical protein
MATNKVTVENAHTSAREKRLRMFVVCMEMTRAIVNIRKFHIHTCDNDGLHKMSKLLEVLKLIFS